MTYRYVQVSRAQAGMSLLELMVSITIGAILMTGLVAMFNTSGESRRELEKTGTLIENGRYAVGLLQDDIRHTGYYGYYYDIGDPPAAIPDPCEVANLTTMEAAMSMPFQGYDSSTGTCHGTLLTGANTVTGSDFLVVRRAKTALADASYAVNEVYLEANTRAANLLRRTGASSYSPSVSLKKYPSKGTADDADLRKYILYIYFVAPCSYGSASSGSISGICQSGDDDIPTLKRLELSSLDSNTSMEIVPLVEGVEAFKVLYGVDDTPAAVNSVTGQLGDGVPDSYTASPANAIAWSNVVSVRIELLMRSTDPSRGYTDTKTYTVAGTTFGPFGDDYRRRVYGTEIRPMNLAGRREIPD